MNIEIKEAKDGNKTCAVDSFFIHSSYKPVLEAERFIDSLTYSFLPEYVLITEPGLSYTADFLRRKFPSAKLICIRYCSNFSEYDSLWDNVIYYDSTVSVSDELFDSLNEEGISKCLFISWKASEKVFEEESNACWNEIRKAVLKSRQVLSTRTYFAKKWFINSIKNSIFIQNTYSIEKAKKPVIVCASGKSLKDCIPFIIQNKDKFHIFCVSSALSPLLANGIIPELCITTDGGYYAKKHISFAAKNYSEIIYALPSEASFDTEYLTDAKILPLTYGDCPGDEMFEAAGIKSVKALRNGTVSGTAAFLSLMSTESEVYFCGLDLSENKGFAHTQPNELELTDSLLDNCFSTKETRIIPQTFKNASLETYRDWFSNTNFGNRLFRLSNDYSFKNTLSHIKDVNFDFVVNKNYPKTEENIFIKNERIDVTQERRENIFNLIKQNLFSENYTSNIFPSKVIMLERCIDDDEKNKLSKDLHDSMNAFFNDICKKFLKSIEVKDYK